MRTRLEFGDRVKMTRAGLKQALGVRGDTKGPCYGTVVGVDDYFVRVRRDGTKQPCRYSYKFWRRVL